MASLSQHKLSRKLCYVLRHGAVHLQLPINSAGFVPLSTLRTKVSGLESLTDEALRHIVANDQKQRFSLCSDEDNQLYVRANQGHSESVANKLDPNQLLQPLLLQHVPQLCVHGTTLTAWQTIRQTGLSRMNRHMIHFATRLPHDQHVVSGVRNSSQVFIFVSVAAAIQDGVPFYRSENDVLLSPGVDDTGILPVKYFENVVRRDTGQLLMKNGQLTNA